MFLKDKEILLNANTDKLGTKPYAETIIQIIDKIITDNIQDPFTIGLFGYWGSGKSTILKTVCSEIDKRNDIVTVNYDAWKYNEDAFRRNFLIEFESQLGLFKEGSKSKYYTDSKVDTEVKIEIADNAIWVGIIILGALAILSFILQHSIVGLISIFSGAILFALKNLIVTKKIQQTTPKLFSPEQFSEEFIKLGDQVFKNEQIKSVIFIIDNLDRCDSKTATELLMTIKNYLDYDNSIFIIPCDDVAIKRHLASIGPEKIRNEFLRKFFDTTIRIKKYVPSDLFDYTIDLLDNNSFSFKKVDYKIIANLIAKSFASNPRRILHFLNNLQSEFLLAQNQENSKSTSIDTGTITNNIAFLTKVLVIKEEWNDLYEIISNDPFCLNLIETQIKDNKRIIPYKGIFIPSTICSKFGDSTQIKLSDDQFKFLKSTLNVNSENIEAFFRLKETKDSDRNNVVYATSFEDIAKQYKINDVINLFVEQMSLVINERDLTEEEGPLIFENFLEYSKNVNYKEDNRNNLNDLNLLIDRVLSFVNFDTIDISELDNYLIQIKNIIGNQFIINKWSDSIINKSISEPKIHLEFLIKHLNEENQSEEIQKLVTTLLLEENKDIHNTSFYKTVYKSPNLPLLINLNLIVEKINNTDIKTQHYYTPDFEDLVLDLAGKNILNSSTIGRYLEKLEQFVVKALGDNKNKLELLSQLGNIAPFISQKMIPNLFNQTNLLLKDKELYELLISKSNPKILMSGFKLVKNIIEKYPEYLEPPVLELLLRLNLDNYGNEDNIPTKIMDKIKNQIDDFGFKEGNISNYITLLSKIKDINGIDNEKFRRYLSKKLSTYNAFIEKSIMLNFISDYLIDYLENSKINKSLENDLKEIIKKYDLKGELADNLRSKIDTLDIDKLSKRLSRIIGKEEHSDLLFKFLREKNTRTNFNQLLENFRKSKLDKEQKVNVLEKLFSDNSFNRDQRCGILRKEIDSYEE